MVVGLNGFLRKDIDALEGRELGRIAYINFSQVGSQNSQNFKWYCADVSAIALVDIFQAFLSIWSKKCLPPFVEITTHHLIVAINTFHKHVDML